MRRSIGLDDWETHLRGLSGRGQEAERPVPHQPEAFFRWTSGDRAGRAPAGVRLDEALWWSVLDAAVDPRRDLEPAENGPLFDQGSSRTIEVWTERELCGLHALWWVAEQRSDPSLTDRASACARWHIENTQPDNATNRPWAAHVFVLQAHRHDAPDARLYAETLIHNCQTSLGRPDPFSALILLDAANALRLTRGGGS